MRSVLCAVLLALPLAACVPVAMEDAGEGVSIRYHPSLAGLRDPDRLAAQSCAAQGLSARLIRTDTEAASGIVLAHYACVDEPGPPLE